MTDENIELAQFFASNDNNTWRKECSEAIRSKDFLSVILFVFHFIIWVFTVIFNFVVMISIGRTEYFKSNIAGKLTQTVAAAGLCDQYLQLLLSTGKLLITKSSSTFSNGKFLLQFLENLCKSGNITFLWLLTLHTLMMTSAIRSYKKKKNLHHIPFYFLLSGMIIFTTILYIHCDIIDYKYYIDCIDHRRNDSFILLKLPFSEYRNAYIFWTSSTVLPGIIKLILALNLLEFTKNVKDKSGKPIASSKNIFILHVNPAIMMTIVEIAIYSVNAVTLLWKALFEMILLPKDYNYYESVNVGLNCLLNMMIMICFLYHSSLSKKILLFL